MRKVAIILVVAAALIAACDDVPLGPDTQAPSITLLSPSAGTTATDSLVVRVNASDNRGVQRVELYIVGTTGAIAVDSLPPYELVGHLADLGSGLKNFTVDAVDSAGNRASTAAVSFTAVITPGLKYIGKLAIDGSARDVAVVFPYAYVAAWDGGVIVVDIRNRQVPLFVTRFDTDGFAQGVAVAGSRLFVADGAEGILALSIANPRAPVEEARVAPSGMMAWQLAVSGNYVFVAGGVNGLYAINAANPDTLIASQPLNVGGDVRDVAVAGNFAYTAEAAQGVRVVNIANPDSMYAVSQYSAIQALDLSLHPNFVFVAAGTEGMYTLNLVVPDSLTFGDSYAPGSSMEGIVTAGSYSYVASGTSGVEIVNSASPTNLVSITNGIFNTGDHAYKLAVDYQYVIVANNLSLTILKYIAP